MFYFYMFVFCAAFIVAVPSFLIFVITKIARKENKSGVVALYATIISVSAFTLGMIKYELEPRETIDKIRQAEGNGIISAYMYSTANDARLIELLGEPDSKLEKSFGSLNNASTWVYDDGQLELLLIDNRVVQIIYYGHDQSYTDINEVFNWFGIITNPKPTLISDNEGILRYQKLDSYNIIDDFWLTKGSSDNTIGTVKIIYDSKHF